MFPSHDLQELTSFINFADNFIQSMMQKVEVMEATTLEVKEKNDSLNKVISNYKIDSYFNKEKADKWLVNALILVIVRGYQYKAPYFQKGEDKIIKTQILN